MKRITVSTVVLPGAAALRKPVSGSHITVDEFAGQKAC